MSIVFIGTPAFALPTLGRLVADGHRISAVITQPDRPAGRGLQPRPSPVKRSAEELGIRVLQPATLREPEAIAAIQSLAPEVMVTVAYGQILRRELLDLAPGGVLNIHPSLLPKYRGPTPIPAALLAGDDGTGVTIILMDAGMDSGPILAQRGHPIEDCDTAASLSDKLSRLSADLLAETLPRWLAGEITPQAQDDRLATKTSLLRKEDGAIDWSRSAVELWGRVRAYNPWPGAFTEAGGKLLHIWRAWPLQGDAGNTPGRVVALDAGQRQRLPDPASATFAVQTGDGLLVPLEVQRAGRKLLSAAEFLRGAPGFIGTRLETTTRGVSS